MTATMHPFGSATVAEIREALAGLVGDTDSTLLMRVGRWMLADGWERGIGEGTARNRRRLMDIWWGPANCDQLTVRMHRHQHDSFPESLTVPVRTVREAIDQLVVWGVVPVEFSSMYAAGRADRAVGGAA